MLNFASMLNSIRNNQTSLSELLSSPTTTLFKLLDDDNFITQFRSGSPQVKEYMTYKRMQELIELITMVGDPSDKKRTYKFPLTAADLLSTQTAFVFDMLLPEDGVIMEEERVVTAKEEQVERELEEDEEDDELEISSSDDSNREEKEDEKKEKLEKTCGEDDEEFGEFVAAPVRQKRTVMVKEVVQTVTIVRKEHPGLVCKIFDYFNTEINYTLTSYCCKVLTSLLNKRTKQFLAKIFEGQHQYLTGILSHIESRSTVQFLIRLFTIETSNQIEQRFTFFHQLLHASHTPKELGVLSNISATLCETFQKINANSKTINPCKDLQIFFSSIPEMLDVTVNNIISENETVSAYAVPFIYQLLLNCPPSQLDNDLIDISLYKFVDGAMGKLRQAVKQKKGRLGVGRVRMVEILNFILKRRKIQEYISQQKDFFSLLIELIKQHPLNNILHNEVFKIIISALTLGSSQLLENLREHAKLIDWLQQQADLEKKKTQILQSKNSNCYTAYLFNLCKQMKQISINNPAILLLINDPRFADIYNIFVERMSTLSSINLGGYATNKAKKYQIMTSREQILKHHSAFLANARPAVFQSEFQNPILLEQLQRQLDGIQFEFTNESRPKEVIEEQKHKAELIQENQQHKSAFWKVHLDYNVDQLMYQVL